MSNSLTIAILGGLGGMLGWGFADFFAKKTIDRIGDLQSLVWAHLCGTTIFIILALYKYGVTGDFVRLPNKLSIWLALGFFGCLQMLVYWLVYIGFGKGQLAVLNPVFASYSGIVALVSLIFFSEKLSGLSGLALVLIFGGILLMNTDLKSIRSKSLNWLPGFREVIAAAALAAIWTLLWDRFVRGQDYLAYALFMYLFMSLAAIALARAKKTKLLPVGNGLWRLLALIGLGEVIAYLSISYGFSRSSHTSVVALLSGAFSLPTIILARVYLKEKVTRLQLLSALIIIIGIIVIALSTG